MPAPHGALELDPGCTRSCGTSLAPDFISQSLSFSIPKVGMGFPGGSAVKNPPAMQEMWVHSLSQEDSLEEGMATHSSILA